LSPLEEGRAVSLRVSPYGSTNEQEETGCRKRERIINHAQNIVFLNLGGFIHDSKEIVDE
jgi:hypothetical protein